MKSIADQLPPEVARQLHPDRRKNEVGYWAARDQLLGQYEGQWVGFADGKVIASGSSPVAVLHAAEATGLHPFFICVGKEEKPCRIRRASFPYDTNYAGEALPQVSVEFRLVSGSAGTVLDRVIPDTGADATVLPWADCLTLQLSPVQGVQSLLGGVAGGSAASLAFQIWARLDGRDYACRLLADFAGRERILGRDVLNRLEILFRGPAGEVVVNP
jgi:predicted aspartyl protease